MPQNYLTVANAPALAEITYDINTGQWGQDLPCLFFYVVGKPELRTPYFAMTEDIAIAFCNRINNARN